MYADDGALVAGLLMSALLPFLCHGDDQPVVGGLVESVLPSVGCCIVHGLLLSALSRRSLLYSVTLLSALLMA